MTDDRTDDTLRSEPHRPLSAQSGLAARQPRVVPLTGDASDRRYFRILLAGRSVDRARAARRADRLRHRCRSPTSRELLAADAAAGAGDPRPLGRRSASSRCRTSATSRCRRTSARHRRPSTRRSIGRRSRSSNTLQRRGAELASDALPAVRHRVRRREAHVGARTSSSGISSRRIAACALSRRRPRGPRRRVVGDRRRARGRAARALPSRLSQPQSDAARTGSLYIIDFQDARMGPDTYDLVVAAARLVRRHLTDRELDELIAYFLALKGTPADAAEFRRRFDLMALQRNLKALGTFGYQTTTRGNPVYIQYIPRTLRYVRTNLEKYPRFARLRDDARAARRRVAIDARWIRARTLRRLDAPLSRTPADPRVTCSRSPRTDSRPSRCSRRGRTSTTTTRRPSPTSSSGWPRRG